MLLSKYKNHRNPKYLIWLRKRKCSASGDHADVAHHVRLGTNGGQGLKPSDYFCIPLKNEYHTGGLWALHNIGEETFFQKFELNKIKIFIQLLQDYLRDEYKIIPCLAGSNELEVIKFFIEEIERRRVDFPTQKKEKAKIPPSEFYEKVKEAKKQSDKKIRIKLKNDLAEKNKIKQKLKLSETEFYKNAKQIKRQFDKDLRGKVKDLLPKQKKTSVTKSLYYQQAKAAKKVSDKQWRAKLKKTSDEKENVQE